jgi:hypothetical protein
MGTSAARIFTEAEMARCSKGPRRAATVSAINAGAHQSVAFAHVVEQHLEFVAATAARSLTRL